MCWIGIIKPKNPIPYEHLDQAQTKNKNGYGVSWFKDGQINTFKTLDYTEFKLKLAEIEGTECIIHLRNTTAGSDCLSNSHPFTIPSGVMFHNGTIFNLKDTTSSESDTNKLATLISKTKYEKITDIAPLLVAIAGTTLNRLVFMDKIDGTISIINRNLGIDDPNGNWYSNTYHVKPKPVKVTYQTYARDYTDDDETHTVFVYGTLKRGFNNHKYLKNAKYLGKAKTALKWAMVNSNGYFPYLLKPHMSGHHVEGELYEVTPDQLDSLDILEGYPTHYDTKYITVKTEEGLRVKVMVYVKTTLHKQLFDFPFIKSFERS